jgi:hypothetical protein
MDSRRDFLAAAGAAGLGALATSHASSLAAEPAADRELYEIREFELATDAQRTVLDAFLKDAAIPALNRLGINPVGVFAPAEGPGPVRVLLRHKTMSSVVTHLHQLAADPEFLAKGAPFLDAPADQPAYTRVASTLHLAFKGFPSIARPVTGPDRVFQLRIYESPSLKTGQKKIEMFNDAGEIPLFERVGLNPVFFGETLVGPRMPCLTYMLGFENAPALDAAWKRFLADPAWERLKAMPEYADKAILSGITNHVLRPTAYSQI